ncbi:MAG: membrane protein insertase YidC [Candidatus Viridilinea halotolerans]|uniref:Membrane protein insertase YidC n=1 Tax=Candidatus Viridilinea halotolerans TaxID=2491704 RepID=A0A426TSG8_9CHLR|nr:MAG: membrane protein insertase YidC [Candidatus Viridilinea halotolerans]
MWSWFVGILELALIWFSSVTGSIALGIMLFTLAARLIILPLTLSSIRSSRRMQELQPLIKELQRKHGKDAQKLQEETMRLYRDNKVNPVGGCLPMLLQLPIFFGVYQAVYHLFGGEMGRQYLGEGAAARLEDPAIHAIFERNLFGSIGAGDVTFGPEGFGGVVLIILPLLSILFQFLQTLMATPRVQDPQQKMMFQMMMFMPLVFGYIAFTFPQGAVLYWVVSSMIGIVQQYFTSGWGSLANYLKFLPPDGKSPTQPALAPASVTTDASGAVVVMAPAPRADFWSVMSPLTETKDVSASEPESAKPASSDPVEDAIARARPQNRPPGNARRSRKRK